MENGTHLASAEQDSAEELPSLFKCLASKTVAGFDNIEESGSPNPQLQRTGIPTSSPSLDHVVTKRTQATACQSPLYASAAFDSKEIHSISTSMLPSPFGHHLGSTKRVLFRDREGASVNNGIVEPPAMAVGTEQLKQEKYRSQPLQSSTPNVEAVSTGKFSNFSGQQGKNPRIDKLNGRNYDSFKTWSGKLERQITHFRGKPTKPKPDDSAQNPENQALPVDRYFDALEGPELDMLKDSEESVLPEDKKWPFLLRYPISSFGICLGVSSQAILWKSLATSASTKFLHISLTVNLFLWCISVVLISIVFFIYLLKVILYFEAVRREYYHPIRVNFFFAPWIALLFLALGVPPTLVKDLHAFLWYILMIPIFCLGLKIYGQWMSGGQRRLSKVANPSNHLAIVGNFVGALLGASMGLKEGPIFFFAIGLAHYVVLFVTLYQRLPTNETLPKELHPVFFLFVAAPSVASMAWARIQGAFDYGSRLAYFIALFLYFSLAVRINFFRGFKFSIAWWAYTFPMTGASVATIRYSNEVTNLVTQSLSVILSGVSTFTVTALLISTVIHAFVLRDLFPNDIAIAITGRRPKIGKKWGHRRSESQDAKDNKSDMKLRKDCKDIEASPKPSVSTGIDVSCQVTIQKV